MSMVRTEVIEWLKSIKEKYIHGGDDFYDHQRRTAIDYAIVVLENVEQPKTNADRIRAMTDKEMATDLLDMFEEICEDGVPSEEWMLHWLKQPAEGE